MDEGVRLKLREILTAQGEPLRRDPQRLEAILRDHCPEGRREIHLLAGAAKAGLVEDLVGAWGSGPPEMLVARLSKRLNEDMGVAPQLARWTIETWAYALYNVRFRPKPAPPPPLAVATATQSARGLGPGNLTAYLAAIPRRIRDPKDPHRLHLLAAVAGAGLLVVLAGYALLKPPSPPPPAPVAQAPQGAGAEDSESSPDGQQPDAGEPGEEEGGFTPAHAKELLMEQFPSETFQVERVVHGSFTAPEVAEAVFVAIGAGFDPTECKSRLYLASGEDGWHMLGEVMSKVTSVAQVVDVDGDGISEVLTSYSCTFRGVLEESHQLVSLNNYPRSNIHMLFSVKESGSRPEGSSSPPDIPYHEIRFREYAGEPSLILCDQITDTASNVRRCQNYHLQDEAYALAESIQGCGD